MLRCKGLSNHSNKSLPWFFTWPSSLASALEGKGEKLWARDFFRVAPLRHLRCRPTVTQQWLERDTNAWVLSRFLKFSKTFNQIWQIRWHAPGVQLTKDGSNISEGAGGFQVQNGSKNTNKQTSKKLNTQFLQIFIYMFRLLFPRVFFMKGKPFCVDHWTVSNFVPSFSLHYFLLCHYNISHWERSWLF